MAVYKLGNLPQSILIHDQPGETRIFVHPSLQGVNIDELRTYAQEWNEERKLLLAKNYKPIYGIYVEPGEQPGEVKLSQVLAPDEPEKTIERIRRITGYLSEVQNWNPGKQAELANRHVHTGATKTPDFFAHKGNTDEICIYSERHELNYHVNLLERQGKLTDDHRITCRHDKIFQYLEQNPEIKNVSFNLSNTPESRKIIQDLGNQLKDKGYNVTIQLPQRKTWHMDLIQNANRQNNAYQANKALETELTARVASEFCR